MSQHVFIYASDPGVLSNAPSSAAAMLIRGRDRRMVLCIVTEKDRHLNAYQSHNTYETLDINSPLAVYIMIGTSPFHSLHIGAAKFWF